MRASNQSALTPDEQAVIRFLLKQAEGEVRVLTDYPTDSCAVTRIGRRQYYYASLAVSEFADVLRSGWDRGPRNAYLPKEGVVAIERYRSPSRTDLSNLFESLGDWCGYTTG